MQLRKMAVLAALGTTTLLMVSCGDDDDSITTCTDGSECGPEEPDCRADPTGAQTDSLICLCTVGGTTCGEGRRCDQVTQQCVDDDGTGPTPTTCDSANQPGTCSYGQFCSAANSTCQAVEEGSCAAASTAPTWNRTGGSAPVIASVSATRQATTNSTTQCGDGGPAGIITINFYAPNQLTTHTTFQDLQQHVRFRRASGGGFVGANFSVDNPPANANQGSFRFGICGDENAPVAIHLVDEGGRTSNVVCIDW